MTTRLTLVSATLLAVLGSPTSSDAQRRRQRPSAETPAEPAPAAPAEASAPSAPAENATPASPAAVPAPTPAPDPDSIAAPPPDVLAPAGPDLAPVRGAYTTLMDELVQARMRVATLGRTLFQSRVRVIVQNRRGDTQSLARLAITLDGASVFRSEDGSLDAEDGRQVFDGFAAPGPHVIGVDLEHRARADDAYRFTQRDGYRFEVRRGKLTEITIVLEDDSDIAEEFADDEEGEYDVRTRVRVATRPLGNR